MKTVTLSTETVNGYRMDTVYHERLYFKWWRMPPDVAGVYTFPTSRKDTDPFGGDMTDHYRWRMRNVYFDRKPKKYFEFIG